MLLVNVGIHRLVVVVERARHGLVEVRLELRLERLSGREGLVHSWSIWIVGTEVILVDSRSELVLGVLCGGSTTAEVSAGEDEQRNNDSDANSRRSWTTLPPSEQIPIAAVIMRGAGLQPN